jgi:hypothetical protein
LIWTNLNCPDPRSRLDTSPPDSNRVPGLCATPVGKWAASPDSQTTEQRRRFRLARNTKSPPQAAAGASFFRVVTGLV